MDQLKATKIDLFSFRTPQMRAFHLAWFAFFLCFFAWFGMAAFGPVVAKEFKLTPDQKMWTMIAAVSATVFARLFFGWLCDQIGPRLSYTILLVVGSIPVMAIGLAHSFTSLLLFRLGIGVIGASFVITQYHTSRMFAPSVVGTANAMTGGWGNLGGGVTQLAMPALLGALVSLGLSQATGWRVAMLIAGIVCLLTAAAYFFLTQDTPEGNLIPLRKAGKIEAPKKMSFAAAAADPRTWCLFVLYAACFGIELTIDNIAHTYFEDHKYFGMAIGAASWAAFSFGGLNIFARALGGYGSDKVAKFLGLTGRVYWLFAIILLEGLSMIWFSQMHSTPPMLVSFIVFGLFVCMGCGAVFAVVPFINKNAVGSVSGIVGAGGNVGAVASGFMFGAGDWHQSLLIIGCLVTAASFLAFGVRFAPVAIEEKSSNEEPSATPALAV